MHLRHEVTGCACVYFFAGSDRGGVLSSSLTPLALAIWIMDDGVWQGSGAQTPWWNQSALAFSLSGLRFTLFQGSSLQQEAVAAWCGYKTQHSFGSRSMQASSRQAVLLAPFLASPPPSPSLDLSYCAALTSHVCACSPQAERGHAGRLIASVPATLAAQGAAMAASRDALLTRAGSAARSEYGATSQQGDSPHSGAVSESGAARSAGGAARSGGGAGTTSSARAGGGAAQQRTVRVASTAAVVMGSAPAGTAAVVAKVKPRLSQVMTSRQAANPLSKTLAQMGAGIGSALSEGAQLQHGHNTALHRPSPEGRAG